MESVQLVIQRDSLSIGLLLPSLILPPPLPPSFSFIFFREHSGWRHWKENYQNKLEHEFSPEGRTVGTVPQLSNKKRENPISLEHEKRAKTYD